MFSDIVTWCRGRTADARYLTTPLPGRKLKLAGTLVAPGREAIEAVARAWLLKQKYTATATLLYCYSARALWNYKAKRIKEML